MKYSDEERQALIAKKKERVRRIHADPELYFRYKRGEVFDVPDLRLQLKAAMRTLELRLAMVLDFNFDFEVAKAALLYLASMNLPNFDKYRAAKLLFISDRDHLLRFGRPITGDRYNALPYGPTPNTILEMLNGLERAALEGVAPADYRVVDLSACLEVKDLAHPTYHALVEPNGDYLSKTDLIVLAKTVEEHGRDDFNTLKAFTHGMKAYTHAWRPNGQRKKFKMPYDSFFMDAPERSEFLAELVSERRLTQALASKRPSLPLKALSA